MQHLASNPFLLGRMYVWKENALIPDDMIFVRYIHMYNKRFKLKENRSAYFSNWHVILYLSCWIYGSIWKWNKSHFWRYAKYVKRINKPTITFENLNPQETTCQRSCPHIWCPRPKGVSESLGAILSVQSAFNFCISLVLKALQNKLSKPTRECFCSAV